MSLPASGFGIPVGGRLTATGELAQAQIVMIASDTGYFWRATLAGAPPSWTFTAAPSCDDIAADFATCTSLEGAVGSCAQLATWGYT